MAVLWFNTGWRKAIWLLPVLFVLVFGQSRFEQESGSPCYEKDQDGNDDLTKSQVIFNNCIKSSRSFSWNKEVASTALK